MKKILFSTAFAATLLSITPLACAQADRDIKYRQGVFTAMAWNMAPMAAMIKGETPYNKDVFSKHAARVSALTAMPWDAFGPGTDKGSKAKPALWKETDKFKELAQRMEAAAKNLTEVAQSGDLDKIKPAFAATGKACSNCHDNYREK